VIINEAGKNFETPETGQFIGTVIDVVDLGKKANRFGEEKVRLRVLWVLNANDSQGQPYRVMREANATVADKPKKSTLYEIVEGVTGQAPAVPFETDVLIGRSNLLIIVKETAPNGKKYANIKAILPLPAGVIPPQAPQGFLRAKDRAARAAQAQVTNGAPAVAVQQVQAQPASQPVAAGKPAVDASF